MWHYADIILECITQPTTGCSLTGDLYDPDITNLQKSPDIPGPHLFLLNIDYLHFAGQLPVQVFFGCLGQTFLGVAALIVRPQLDLPPLPGQLTAGIAIGAVIPNAIISVKRIREIFCICDSFHSVIALST
jgi:hypothetical protein